MRQTEEFDTFYRATKIIGISILVACAVFFIWKLFLSTPVITFVPNTRHLTMLQMLKENFGEHVDEKELTLSQLEKMRKVYAHAITIDGPINELERYRMSHRLDGTWQTGSTPVKSYIFTDNVVPSQNYYRKYIR